MNTRAITEGAMMAALTVIIALLAFYVPFLSVLVYFFIALPTVIVYRRYGFTAAFLEGLTATLLLLLFMDFFNALIYGANILFPGLALGYTYQKGKDGFVRFVAGYLAFLSALIVEIVVFQFVTGTSITQDFLNEINSSFNTVNELYSQAGLLSSEELQSLSQNLQEVQQMYAMIFPTIVLLTPAAISYIDLLIYDRVMKLLRLSYVPLKPITQWKLPPSSEHVIAFAFVVAFLVGLIDNPNVQIYANTVIYIILAISWVLGLSFVFWLIQVKSGKPMRFVRFLIILLGIIFPIGAFLLAFIGMLDMFFNFRKYFASNKK